MNGEMKWSDVRNEGRRRQLLRGERQLFRAEAEPDGELILIRIPALRSETRVASFSDIEKKTRDLVSIALGVSPDSFDLAISMAGAARERDA